MSQTQKATCHPEQANLQKWKSPCLPESGRRGREGVTRQEGFFSGAENITKLDSSDHCTTLKIMKITGSHTLK
jgi:hypothetical protein